MLLISRSTLVVLSFLLVTVVADGQGGQSLQGRVIAPNGTQPNVSVKITLTYNGRRVHETFSDLSGRFSFTGLNQGTYQLTAEGDGENFETTTVYAEVSAFGSSGQSFSQDIQLRPVKGKPLPHANVVNAFNQNVPKPALQMYERAMKFLSEGKVEAGVEKLQEAIKLFPDYFEAHLQLGNQFMKLGRLGEAIAELDRAREINPSDERLYQSFGLVLMRQKNYAVAVAVFSEAARLSPTNPVNPLMKATAMIHQAYSLDPSKDAGDLQRLLGKTDIALAEVARLSDPKLKLDPLSQAMLYQMKGDNIRAANELESYLRDKPNDPNAAHFRKLIDSLRSPASEATQPKMPQ